MFNCTQKTLILSKSLKPVQFKTIAISTPGHHGKSASHLAMPIHVKIQPVHDQEAVHVEIVMVKWVKRKTVFQTTVRRLHHHHSMASVLVIIVYQTVEV